MINLLRIAHTYSGKPGKCMCGCSGRHAYASAFAATNGPGYEPTISDRSVQKIVSTMNSILERQGGKVEETSEYVCVEIETRVYVAYFAKELIGDHRAGLVGC